MAAEWHYGQGEEQHGPVPLEELKQLVASGTVQPTDMVWNADMPDWLPAKDVAELFPKQESASQQAAEASPPVPSEQSAAASSAPSRRLPIVRTAAIGLGALCVVGIVVAAWLIFRNRPEPETPDVQPAEVIDPENLPKKVEDALATLKTNPADPGANLVVGRYYCFNKNDWDKGLPLLVQGSDGALKELATADLRKPTEPAEQMKLGDRWWGFAGSHVQLAWKSSQQRAVHWYREALPHLNGSAIADIAKKLKRLDEQPSNLEVLTRRAKVFPDDLHGSASCANMVLEVSRTGTGPAGTNPSLAGLQLKGVRYLNVAVNASPDLRRKGVRSFAGFMVDYHAESGFTKRVALTIGAFDKDRTDKRPGWGKHDVPDEYVDLGSQQEYDLDLQKWAPPGWDGQAWFGLVLQQAGADTSITAQLMPLAKQP